MSSPAGVPLPPGAVAGGVPGSAEAAAAAAARSSELWFKAATIAVPICGALILVLLIVLAVRLLRADGQHQRASKLSACAFPPLSDKKVPLLACGAVSSVAWGHGTDRLGGFGGGFGGGCAPPTPPKNPPLAKLNFSASYDLLDLQRHGGAAQRSVLGLGLGLGHAPARPSYRQVLASFVPWATGGSAVGAAEPAVNV